jgi:ATP-binding cassette, subfamily B, bacterial MsbA
MRLYVRLLGFLRPHMRLLVLSIVCMTVFAAFSGGTVALIVPFSRIIFQGGNLDTPASVLLPPPAAPSGSSSGSPSVSAGPNTSPTPSSSPAREPGWIKTIQEEFKARVYSAVRGRDPVETLGRFCLLILLVFLLKNLFWYAQSFLIVKVEQGVIRDIRNRIYLHYLELPVEYYNEARAGTLLSRITNDVSLVRGAIANGFAQAIRQTLLSFAYLAAVLSANWKLFLLTLLVAPPSFYLIGNIGRRLRRHSTRSQEKMGDLTGALQETITGVRVIKSFNLEKLMGERFRRLNQAYTNAMVRMTRTGSLAPPVTEILGATVGVVILYIGGRDIVHGTGMDAGRFLMFLVALFALMQPIRTLSQVNIQIQEGLAAATRIFQVLDTEPSLAEKADATAMPVPIREIEFDAVCFSYVEGKPVLTDVSFAVPAGSMIAIVGPSGAGKTTLVDMLPRFYDPQSGAVRLNGTDLRDLSVSGLRGAIGLVTQETVLFDDSVEANIALGRPGAAREEIEAAARAANADAFIREMPEGYATQIGDRGLKLSGGQRQRLAIARAILKNPPILIFDEATSALDSESEALVQEALDRLIRDRTTFVIAHRLSTVRRADRILVIEGGRISDTGSHEELLARGGTYRRLHDMQFRDP